MNLQDFGFRGSETLVGMLEQFLRNGEIHQRGMNIAVTEIGGQIWQSGLRIDSLLVPLRHPMDDKGMAEIVNRGRQCGRRRLSGPRLESAYGDVRRR